MFRGDIRASFPAQWRRGREDPFISLTVNPPDGNGALDRDCRETETDVSIILADGYERLCSSGDAYRVERFVRFGDDVLR